MNEMRRIVPEYCDCGHLVSPFHPIWKDQNNNPHSKCFGADTDWWFRTVGNMDFNDEDFYAELVEKDVVYKCTKINI
jgi:hypothetical protein